MKSVARILLFTGDGKGKTTAALGMVLRAAGHGQRILVLQFLKNDSATGEIAACGHLPGVEFVQSGRGFVPPPDSPDFLSHREAAERALKIASESINSRKYDLIVLDEICNAVAKGLLREEDVLDVIRRAGPETCIVLTGRNASPGLLSLADTVTEMRCCKHGLKAGREAQKGVEF